MHITKLDNSALLVRTGTTTIAIDFGKDVPACDVDGLSVDVVLVSHLHADHHHLPHAISLGAPVFAAADIADVYRAAGLVVTEVLPGQRLDLGDLTVTAHEVDHGDISFPVVNLAFELASDRLRVFYAGDIAVDSMPRPSGRFDAVLVPVGGGKVFAPQDAVAYASHYIGATIIPVHFDNSAAALVEFCERASAAGLTVAPLGNRESVELGLEPAR